MDRQISLVCCNQPRPHLWRNSISLRGTVHGGRGQTPLKVGLDDDMINKWYTIVQPSIQKDTFEKTRSLPVSPVKNDDLRECSCLSSMISEWHPDMDWPHHLGQHHLGQHDQSFGKPPASFPTAGGLNTAVMTKSHQEPRGCNCYQKPWGLPLYHADTPRNHLLYERLFVRAPTLWLVRDQHW